MPEGDAVWRTARRLDPLVGQPLILTDLRTPSTATFRSPGARITEVATYGKHLLMRLDSGFTIHSHLRMEGSWRVHPTRGLPRRLLHHHTVRAVMATDTHTAIGDRLGALTVIRTNAEHTITGRLGPDVLSPSWDEDQATANVLACATTGIAVALLDQRNLAGLGTIFTAEPLFSHRINPWSRIGDLDAETVRAVIRTAQQMIAVGAGLAPQPEGRGRRVMSPDHVAVSAPRSTHGAYVHGRSRMPCRRCRGSITHAPITTKAWTREFFYCPGCQGGPDDV